MVMLYPSAWPSCCGPQKVEVQVTLDILFWMKNLTPLRMHKREIHCMNVMICLYLYKYVYIYIYIQNIFHYISINQSVPEIVDGFFGGKIGH